MTVTFTAMRRVALTILTVALAIALLAAPAGAKSRTPNGVTTAQWVDYCNHASNLIIGLEGISNQIINDPQAGIATTYADMLRGAARGMHRDAVKIRGGNEKLAGRIDALSRAVEKTRKGYLATAKLKFRSLQIASSDIPDCV